MNTAIASTPIVIGVDQGTGSTKALALDAAGNVVATSAVTVSQVHPRPGWVEQDPTEIVESVRRCIEDVRSATGGVVAAIGLSSQRESAIAWDRRTGRPLGPMLGWQDRRTSHRVDELADHAARIRSTTGLPLDPMFSALKFEWLLDAIDTDRRRARAGEICLGTVDSYVVHALTGEHRIEVGNASRTQLLDLATGAWDESLCELFSVPIEALPLVVASNHPTGAANGSGVEADGAAVRAVLADSHAALYAHGIREPGAVKVTYGTGSSVMGLGAPDDSGALVRTIAWGTPDPVLATEGNILSSGSTIVWLAGVLGVAVAQLADMAIAASGDHGIDLVPAFAGLGAPHWDERAVAILRGVSLGTGRPDLARAAMESVVLQVEDVLEAMDDAAGRRIDTVMVDGGAARNDWLMQLQADLSQRRVVRTDADELSALGAARLAGVAAHLWDDTATQPGTTFVPKMRADAASSRRARWKSAVAAARAA